jgi:UDP-N-acetylmuramate dehydrogenase
VVEELRENHLQSVLRHCGAFVREKEPLGPWTTWRIGGAARLFARPTQLPELLQLFDILRAEQIPWVFLGLGSNVLVSDDGLAGVVIRPKGDFSAIHMENAEIVAGPTARLFDMTVFAARRGLSGIESLCGIPGSVGGGLFMNAGAFGGQISDRLKHLELLEPDGTTRTLEQAEVSFAYRTAPRLKEGIVLHSRFTLERKEPREIWGAMREVWNRRRRSQPLDMPSAGSVFKRPPGDFAGRLIEAVGVKGLRIGGAQVSTKHANFFLNVGGATAADIVALIRKVRHLVYDKFGVWLEPEVKPLGFSENPFEVTGDD